MKPRAIARRLLRRAAASVVPLRNLLARSARPGTPLVRIISALGASAAGSASRARLSASRCERRLRIGVDIRPFYEPLTGVGWYLYHLLEEIAARDDVELLLFGDAAVTDDGPRLHVPLPAGARYVFFDFRGTPLPAGIRSLARIGFPLLVWLERCDVVFGANYFLPRALSAVARRRVVTVHDLTFRRHPELLQNETLSNLDREMSREIFRADAVICVSEATRRDLLSFFDLDPSKTFAIHSGLAALEAGETGLPALPPRFILFVSTIEPRKNLDVLVRAFEKVKDTGRYEGALVVVGKVGWKSEETVRRIRESRWAADIVHLDYLGRGALGGVYSGAEMFVFPSIYEGFGFPLLEAMSFGVPSIAARSSSLPEIGGDAALYFESGDEAALADAISRVAADPELRRHLAEQGRARASEFLWSIAAEKTLDVFRSVAGAPRSREQRGPTPRSERREP